MNTPNSEQHSQQTASPEFSTSADLRAEGENHLDSSSEHIPSGQSASESPQSATAHGDALEPAGDEHHEEQHDENHATSHDGEAQAHVSNPGHVSQLIAAASERRLCVELEAMLSSGVTKDVLARALGQPDASGQTAWILAVKNGEYASVLPIYLGRLDLKQPVEGKTFLEFCLEHSRETGDWVVKSLKKKSLSRERLLEPWGKEGSAPLAHLLASHGHLHDFLAKLTKRDSKAAEVSVEASSNAEHAALLELAAVSIPAPSDKFGSRQMNLLGSMALSGNFNQLGETFFSTVATVETLLPPDFSPETQVHFVSVAREFGKLTQVSGGVWKRLQRLEAERLNEVQRTLLTELLGVHAQLVAEYCARLEADPTVYHREIPPDFKSEPAILAVQRRNELKRFEENPIPFEHLPQRFQQGEDAFLAWSKPWIKHLASRNFSFDSIPEKLREHPDALDAWARPWIELLRTEAVEAYKIPPQLRQDPRVIEARVQYYCGSVKGGNEQALRAVPAELRELPDMADAMLAGWVAWFGVRGIDGWEQLPAEMRAQETLQTQCAILWIERVKALDVDWPKIPAEVRAQQDVVKAWLGAQPLLPQMEASFAEVAAVPSINKNALQLWRNSNHWNRQKASTMLIELRNAPWQFDKLQPSAQAHPMIRAAAYEGLCELVRGNWAYFQLAPEAFRLDEELLELAIPEWFEGLKEGRITWEQVPAELHPSETLQDWKNKQDAKSRKVEREEKQAKVQSKARVEPHLPDSEFTKKELKNAGIRKVRSMYWARRIQTDPLQYLDVPESLLDTPAVETAMRNHWGPIVHSNPDCYHDLPERIRADVGIQRVYRIKTRPPEEALES
jgi:hypothetical protein